MSNAIPKKHEFAGNIDERKKTNLFIYFSIENIAALGKFIGNLYNGNTKS